MGKYRKKPVVVDAYQADHVILIKTLEGSMRANPGDWIITGVHGERYPCKPDIFAETYEPVDDEQKAENSRPVVRGRFVHDGPRFAGGVDWWHCSNCGSLVSGVETRFAFCPHCGADMRPKNEGMKNEDN